MSLAFPEYGAPGEYKKKEIKNFNIMQYKQFLHFLKILSFNNINEY